MPRICYDSLKEGDWFRLDDNIYQKCGNSGFVYAVDKEGKLHKFTDNVIVYEVEVVIVPKKEFEEKTINSNKWEQLKFLLKSIME